ncbi:phosphofructokinase [Nitzschia inconspicua]|uniref:Phosphofructokinase n=1 Tax=Nitzschia inconspicua TaxID=303405 RepID=A0A9K3PPF7_9STRA|nr:phosphofructokinase [Nitzschia inconspicua]
MPSSSAGTLATVIVACSVTAAVTFYLTAAAAERKVLAEKKRQYERDLELKEKTIAARKLSGEPTGEVIGDVTVDKVYLWNIEDLKKRFTPCNIENVMRNKASTTTNPYYFPSMKKSASNDSMAELSDGKPTPYNKLITNHECVLGEIVRKPNQQPYTHGYVRAGPRRLLHFDPAKVNAAIVTCGGLCPGLNNVIREIVNTLSQTYGIGGKIFGIQGGYNGFHDFEHYRPVELTPELVANIHHEGGTVLGSSRGGFDLDKILHFLKSNKVSCLFVIGGDGTHRGAFRIHEGCMEQGMNVAIAGIPKTIDNDVDYIDRSFGFESSVEAAQVAIRSAKTEAICNMPNGIGVVKLMGRSAGFLAGHATMASGDVDLCLLPEVPIVLDGEKGCLPHLRKRVKEQGYAVVVVAEGAGEDLLGVSAETDASGNKKLPAIGTHMKQEIEKYFKEKGDIATVKYIDPSYTVRSVPANASDSLYCMQLGQNAVHGAMAGFTGFSVGLCNNRMVFIPIPELVSTSPRSMNPHGRTWERILAITRQPNTVV